MVFFCHRLTAIVAYDLIVDAKKLKWKNSQQKSHPYMLEMVMNEQLELLSISQQLVHTISHLGRICLLLTLAKAYWEFL